MYKIQKVIEFKKTPSYTSVCVPLFQLWKIISIRKDTRLVFVLE